MTSDNGEKKIILQARIDGGNIEVFVNPECQLGLVSHALRLLDIHQNMLIMAKNAQAKREQGKIIKPPNGGRLNLGKRI